MGTLKPGATLIYEHVDGVTYAREFGQSQRQIVGIDVSSSHGHRTAEVVEWLNALEAARSNPALQDAVDCVKVLYNLSKTHE